MASMLPAVLLGGGGDGAFCTQKRVPKRYQRCSCCPSWGCCYQIFKVLRLCPFSTDRYETFHTY